MEIRTIFKNALPEAEERISWSMPTYWKGRNIIRFAASKTHLGIYPGDEATAAFAEELSDYSVSKGAIRLPYDKPLPVKLLEKIAKWCYEKYVKLVNVKMTREGSEKSDEEDTLCLSRQYLQERHGRIYM